MKATILLIADNEAENYRRSMMLETHKHGKMRFEMASREHISVIRFVMVNIVVLLLGK